MTVFAFVQPDTARNVLLILLGGWYLGYHALRWWRKRPKAEKKKDKEKVKLEGQGQEGRGEEKAGGGGQRNLASGASSPLNGAQDLSAPPAGPVRGRDVLVASTKERCHHSSTTALDFDSFPVHRQHQPPPSTSSFTDEALFDQARAMPHQMIPDFDRDGPYLDLLGRLAQKGYVPALAKLGEYAMRRAAWVEAYYWMKQAQRSGMHGLSPTLREIRKHWAQDGFPRQASNVNELFPSEAGSLGLALLRVDSGHETAAAKEFLRTNHPEFLP